LAKTLVDVDAASFASSGGLIALVTHALRLSIDQGALRVGRTEDVGTGTFTFCSLVGLRANTELSSATKGIARTVTVALTGLHADAG
jgi:hypothetical protein